MKLNTTEVHAAHEWMAKHPKEIQKYIGKWIAISIKGIVASAATLTALMKKPEVQLEQRKTSVLFAPVPDPSINYVA